jgi:hypothetical protein
LHISKKNAIFAKIIKIDSKMKTIAKENGTKGKKPTPKIKGKELVKDPFNLK